MSKDFIKMNNNENELSLGNIIRIIKENSINKHLANQAEIFCIIFDLEDVNESTVNNYCIGARAISNDYKEKYIALKNKYTKHNETFINIIGKISSLVKGNVDEYYSFENINENKILKHICISLYNISKNDQKVLESFSGNLHNLIEQNDFYNCLTQVIIYSVLEHKQPVYVSEQIKTKLENILYKTNISIESLEEFINIQFDDGINYDYTIRKLASKNNPYALFEMGLNEYYGKMTGYPRYNKAYEYFENALKYNHPRATYIAGRMLLEGKIGNQTKEDIDKGLNYLEKASELNNVASLNVLGKYYLKNNNVKKAIEHFEKATQNNYVYAYNNLGKIYKEKKQYEKAFSYYLKSANLEESWACNKIGEMYRLGIGIEKDLKQAFNYYNKALNAPINNIENYAKYNLAYYFYLNGNYKANVEKDEEKAIKLLEESSDILIESLILLLCFYVKEYLNKKTNVDKINEYKTKIENHNKFNEEYKKKIEDILQKIKEKPQLKINI